MDKYIIAIGGGTLKDTTPIDKYIVSLSSKDKPRVLFIPIASGDNGDYIERFKEKYSQLNTEVDVLYLQNTTNDNYIRSKIFGCDIIYIGGGNTAKMMRIFKRTNVNHYLVDAYNRGIILTGLSAGAMAYFKCGYSDSNKMINPEANMTKVNCLDIIHYCFCPHYQEEDRVGFDDFVKEKGFDAIALDDNLAIVFKNETIEKVVKSDNNARAFIFKDDVKERID